MLPRHIDDIDDESGKRKAHAPYNFVELPNKILEVNPEFLLHQNRYYSKNENRYTGRFECILTTNSPLYIRCGLTREEFECGTETKDLPDFFYTEAKTKKPVLPGSSLRGMLRNIIEIVSFSKIVRVSGKKVFYRSLGDKSIQKIYTYNFIEESELPHPDNPSKKIPCYRSKVHAGFLRKRIDSYVIEVCHYGRIDRNKIPYFSNQPRPALYLGKKPGATPNWKYQHQSIYVDIDAEEENHFFQRQETINKKNGKSQERHPDIFLQYRSVKSASLEALSGMKPATLLITGDMQNKHLEFVFLHEIIKEYPVSDEVIQSFQDDGQITKWQEDAFPKDKPNYNCRQKDGFIQDGEPVFFLLDDRQETVRFMGRAQMFRLPYNSSPFELIPESLRNLSVIDIADSIFGYLDGKGKKQDRAGRIFISDANCRGSDNIWCKEDLKKTLTPKILASPKLTTFQHYLVQSSTDRNRLRHYSFDGEEEKTVIRGHKLYWHKPDVKCEDIQETDREKIERSRSQYTDIKPIKAGVSFNFNIHFENLNNIELGALLWVLNIAQDEQYCLSLGMGKPLGMGAVKISHELHLSDRSSRYSKLFNENQWLTGEEDQNDTALKHTACVEAFEDYVVNNIDENDHPEGCKATKLEEIPRIQMLLAMLRCDNPPAAEETRYMTIEPNEYKDRPVLPTPLQIKNIPDKRRRNSLPSKPSLSTQAHKVIEKPKTKPKQQEQNSRNDSHKRHLDEGNGGNFATARPQKPPKPKR